MNGASLSITYLRGDTCNFCHFLFTGESPRPATLKKEEFDLKEIIRESVDAVSPCPLGEGGLGMSDPGSWGRMQQYVVLGGVIRGPC